MRGQLVRMVGLAGCVALACLVVQTHAGRAQPATPPVPTNASVIADGLVNPRGFTWGPDGALYVAEAGTPPATSNSGRILRIAPDGTRTTVADGLPVSVGMGGRGNTIGAAGVAFLGDDLYALISAGPKHGHPEMPGGVYRVETDGSLTLIADTDAYNVAHPPVHANHPPAADELSNPYDMVAVEGKLYITDGNKDVIHVVDPAAPEAGRIDRLADLSLRHRVLTGIAGGPDGKVYVTQLTPSPFPTGGAKVWRVNLDGEVEEVASGLSAATGLAVGPDGTLYVAEFATTLERPPFFAPPGRIVQIGRDGTLKVLATVPFPTILRWGADGLYATSLSVGSNAGTGAVFLLATG